LSRRCPSTKLSTQADALLIRGRRLLSGHRTRAKRDGAALDYDLTDIRRLLTEHAQCEYCSMPLSFAVSLDHRTPIGRGGRHQLANLPTFTPVGRSAAETARGPADGANAAQHAKERACETTKPD
jgi:hypothetical protein